MEKRNVTLRIPEEHLVRVMNFLKESGMVRRKVDNTLWSFEGNGTYFNMYPSGILLIQGKGANEWGDRVLSLIKVPEGALAGCDEAGKGDIFGPLVLSCAVLLPEKYREVLTVAPKDSKRMGDSEIMNKYARLKTLIFTRSVVIRPEKFNRLIAEVGNLNRIMDNAYRKLISHIRREISPARIVIDAYSSTNPFADVKNVLFEKKGERYPEVSCASIVARAKFLAELRKIEDLLGHKVPKGASSQARVLGMRLVEKDPSLARRVLKISFLGRDL